MSKGSSKLVDLARMALAEVGCEPSLIFVARDGGAHFLGGPGGEPQKAGRLAAIHLGLSVRCDSHQEPGATRCLGVSGADALAGVVCGAAQ